MPDIIREFRGEYSWLSNFAPYGFVESIEEYTHLFRTEPYGFVDGKRVWPTVEHYYQASKTDNFEDFKRIFHAETPALAKKLGRHVSMRSRWENIKLNIMYNSLLRKLNQNEELIYKLKSTGKAEIVEGNYWHDNYWGTCYCPKCQGKGSVNYLGKMYMFLRDLF